MDVVVREGQENIMRHRAGAGKDDDKRHTTSSFSNPDYFPLTH